MLMLQIVIRCSIVSARMASPRYSNTWPVPPPTPIRAMSARMMSLAPTPGREAAVDADLVGLRVALEQGLGREDHLDLARPDPEGERPERAVRRRVRVTAHDRHPGLGQAELRPDDVDDALRRGADAVERDAELGAVALELVDLGGRLQVQHRQAARRRRDGVVRGRDRLRRPTHGEAPLSEPGEGLRGRDLVDEVQVDGEDRGRTVVLATTWSFQILSTMVRGGVRVLVMWRRFSATQGRCRGQPTSGCVRGWPGGRRARGRAAQMVRPGGYHRGALVEPASGTTGAVTSAPHANARQGVRMHPLGSGH